MKIMITEELEIGVDIKVKITIPSDYHLMKIGVIKTSAPVVDRGIGSH